jgi:uncharacterized protein
MDPIELVRLNLLSPVVLAFVLGIVATLIRSDLRFPEELYTALSIYLLLAIGLKGGVELADTPLADFWKPAIATLVIGVVTPLTTYFAARKVGRLSVPDSAALAAHYGSVSVVTFFACLSFLQAIGTPAEAFMPTLVALLEIPAIIVGLSLAHSAAAGSKLTTVLREVVTGRSIVLLVGGLAIGFLSGRGGVERVAPLFVDLFQGALMLFLLDMGMVAARRLRDLGRAGPFLGVFAVVVPIAHGALGAVLGHAAGLSVGGTTVMAVLAASASYIAAPAAVRLALPEANPSLYLTAALGVTFPFNLTFGIPLYYYMARFIAGA